MTLSRKETSLQVILYLDWKESSVSWEERVGRKLCITAVNLLKCFFIAPFISYKNSVRQKNDIIPHKHSEVKWLATNHIDSDFIFGIVNLEWGLWSNEDPEFTPCQHLATGRKWNVVPFFPVWINILHSKVKHLYYGVSRSRFLGLVRSTTWCCSFHEEVNSGWKFLCCKLRWRVCTWGRRAVLWHRFSPMHG